MTRLNLPRATYYDRLKREKKPDKHSKIKAFIQQLFYASKETYEYRRIYDVAVKNGYCYAEETIRHLMNNLGMKVTIYSKHASKYSSYKGRVGKITPNILKQQFNAKKPLTVLHTECYSSPTL